MSKGSFIVLDGRAPKNRRNRIAIRVYDIVSLNEVIQADGSTDVLVHYTMNKDLAQVVVTNELDDILDKIATVMISYD